MSFPKSNRDKLFGFALATMFLTALALLVPASSRLGQAQEKTAASDQAGGNGDVARGKYIVEDVAMCGTCHTPRLPNGEIDHSRWLTGAPDPYLPAQPRSDWPVWEPRLAGQPPASNEEMVTLLTTAIWIDGKHLRDPMPKFHMTRQDAEAVVAYLRSLTPRP